jgi:hypothetical protein
MLSHDHHGPCGCPRCNEADQCSYCGSQYRPECADCHGPVDADDHEIDDERLIAMGIEAGAIQSKRLILMVNSRSAVSFGRSRPFGQGLSQEDVCSVVAVGGAA